jgi:hypothetical protein
MTYDADRGWFRLPGDGDAECYPLRLGTGVRLFPEFPNKTSPTRFVGSDEDRKSEATPCAGSRPSNTDAVPHRLAVTIVRLIGELPSGFWQLSRIGGYVSYEVDAAGQGIRQSCRHTFSPNRFRPMRLSGG